MHFKRNWKFYLILTSIVSAITSNYLFCKTGDVVFYNIPDTQATAPIVIQFSLSGGTGGLEGCVLAQDQSLLSSGITSIIVCVENTFISNTAQKLGLPVVTCAETTLGSKNFIAKSTLKRALQEILSRFNKNPLLGIHCHWETEALLAKKLAPEATIILTQHGHLSAQGSGSLPVEVRKILDGIITVNKDLEKAVKKLNEENSIFYPITTLPPFFNNKKFTSYNKTKNHKAFFESTFSIKLKNCPLILKTARFYGQIDHKNHPLLFKAIQQLIYFKNCPVQLALAGDGENFEMYKKMVDDLGISDYVYFLGYTEHTPALLKCVDINLLSSKNEGFGIALLEGGLMKKPTIIAKGTGAADWLIIDKETGFLFENNDVQSLADTIQYVLSHKEEAAKCGQRLYEKVMAEFIPERNVERLIEFYKTVARNKYTKGLNT